MPWFAIVLPVTRRNEQWAFAGPNGEPGQLAQPDPVVVPIRSSLPWTPQQTTTIQPASWVDAGSNTVWYFSGCFNPWVDDLVKGTGAGVTPTPTTVTTNAWGWWARFRFGTGNSSRTFSGERPTQAGAKLACYTFIKAVDAAVTADAQITDSTDMAV